MNAFSNETCLNVKHQPFIFQHIVLIYLNTYWLIHAGQTVWERDATAAIAGSVAETTHREGLFISNTFSSTSKLLTPNMYCWFCKTCVTIYWMHLRVNGIWPMSFCPEKMKTEWCSLRHAFSGSVAIFIIDKWLHSDVIVIKLRCYSELNYVENLYVSIFIFLKK